MIKITIIMHNRNHIHYNIFLKITNFKSQTETIAESIRKDGSAFSSGKSSKLILQPPFKHTRRTHYIYHFFLVVSKANTDSRHPISNKFKSTNIKHPCITYLPKGISTSLMSLEIVDRNLNRMTR